MEPTNAIKLSDKTILIKAQQALTKNRLCDSCLGRLFAQIESGQTNANRGKQLKQHLKYTKTITPQNCEICQGLIDEMPYFIELITKTVHEYDYTTFLIGTKIDEDIQNDELLLQDEINTSYSEPLKTELNREIGKKLEHNLNKTVDFNNPEIMIILDTVYDNLSLQIKPLYLYGKYNKLSRKLPQTRWYCKICMGKGCRRCKYTGTTYTSSVEEIIEKHVLEITWGSEAVLHGAGREDIDVRMLGRGRPFVMEIKNPKKRHINLTDLEKTINDHSINLIEIHGLRYSDKLEIQKIKSVKLRKIYRVVFIGKTDIRKEKLKEAAQVLQDKTITQFTPTRVAHRRANKTRPKNIYNCKIESVEGTIATLTIEAESGTYIKELITGDEGKTTPSISELINIPCRVKELDVMEIQGE